MKKVSPKKKMMTGGKANPNASASVQTTPGSPKGTMVKLNPNQGVESSAGSTKLKKGGATKTKMMYGGSKASSMKKMGKKK